VPSSADGNDDPALDGVEAWLRSRSADLPGLFAHAVRQAIDEVIDGPRTGRWSADQLEKTEKIYVGTKIEIVVRAALDLERAGKLDTVVDKQPVDFKWSFTSQWQIPTEAVGEICLVIGTKEDEALLDVGLVRCAEETLNPGRNKDGKRTLSQKGRTGVRWVVRGAALPSNFISTLDPALRAKVMRGGTGQARIRTLFTSLVERPIPRLAVETVAQQRDPMRRLRADRGSALPGLRVFSARYGNKELVELGYPPLAPDEFMSVPLRVIERGGRASGPTR